MSNINKINIPILKSNESNFNSELNDFTNRTYSVFSSSYLKNCSDPYVLRISNKLQSLYSEIKNSYNNIDKWWIDYNNNAESLENYLSNGENISSITESSIINSINKLPELQVYSMKLEGIIRSAAPVVLEGAFKAIQFQSIAQNISNAAIDAAKSTLDKYESKNVAEKYFDDIYDSVMDNVSPDVKKAIENSIEFVDNTVTSAGEALDSFGNFVYNGAKELSGNVSNYIDDVLVSAGDMFEDVCCFVTDGVENIWSSANEFLNDASKWVYSDLVPFVKQITSCVWDVIKSVGATVVVVAQSLVGGILQFAEAAVDLVSLIATVGATVITGLFDFGQVINSLFTGNEWSSATKGMWKNVKGFVANKYVSGWFDSLYQNTAYGKWLAENAFCFDLMRSIGEGIGYIGGVVILTIATAGVGGVVASGGTVTASTAAAATSATNISITAGAAGLAKGTERAWADGAETVEGLVYGTISGLWDGCQFYLGGKISGVTMFGPDGVIKSIGSTGMKTNFFNSVARVALDSADAGAEGIVQPLLQMMYKDGFYDENGVYIEFTDDNFGKRYIELFDDNGGFKNVLTNAAIGGATSTFGEVFTLNKYFKDNNSKLEIEEVKPDISVVDPVTNDYKISTDGMQKIEAELVNEWFENNKIDAQIGKKIEELFFDDDYIYGIHRTALPSAAENIDIEGLRLTGHGNSGGAFKSDNISFTDLETNISFTQGNGKWEYAKFMRDIMSASYYKNYFDTNVGYAIIVKIPKDKLGNVGDLIDYSGDLPKLKSEYIAAKIEVSDGNILLSNNTIFSEGNIKVDVYGNPINKFDIKQTEGHQIIDNYIKNIEDYLKKGVSFEDYLKSQNIDVKRFSNYEELAINIGDSKLYLFNNLKKLASNDQGGQLTILLDKYSKISVGDIDPKEMFYDLKPFLTDEEINTYLSLSKNGVSDKISTNFSYEQFASVYNYTSAGGFEINAWLNNTTLPGPGGVIDARTRFDSLGKIQNLCSGIKIKNRTNWRFETNQGSIIDGLDSVIASAKYDDAIITYRGVKELWNKNQKLDPKLLKPGDSFTSSGYQSSSILNENNFSYKNNDSNIILEIVVPPKSGVATYIENISGVTKWNQSEVLIKRNAIMTIVGDCYETEINGVMKTVVPVVVY